KKTSSQGLDPALESIYRRLCELSRPLTRIQQLDIEAETYLLLKDALREDLARGTGEQSVFLVAEGEPQTTPNGLLPDVRIDSLSVLQKNNPLAWVGLGRSFGLHLLETATSLEALRLDL